MGGMEEELTRAKGSVTSMATMGQQEKVNIEPEPEPEVGEASEIGTKSAQVLTALREELAAQEALREKER